EKPMLKALPASAYEFAIWKRVKVNIDYHIEFEKNFYSVPYQLVKQDVEIRVTAKVVEVFHKHRRIASNPRQKA
ncbi:MAG: Mu transposase domain-containing protein, partial [Bacillota bacterium]